MKNPDNSSNLNHHVHFIGIGGIGMSYLARWFLSQGWTVSGSDLTDTPLVQELRDERVVVVVGTHKATSLPPETELVIKSQAIAPNNPELAAALKKGVQVYSLPEMVGILTRENNTIAVAGAHGKSTTTALIGLILMSGELDPTIFIGTKLKELDGKNFRLGKNKYLVVEADEYGRAFHQYSPAIAVVTNIDAEHLDVYKNLSGVKEAFLKFLLNIQQGGLLVLNKDDANLYSLSEKIEQLVQQKDATLIWYSVEEEPDLAAEIKTALRLHGRHNLSNALAAVHVGEYLGTPREVCLKALNQYQGAWRRMEFRGDATFKDFPTPVPVFDDYAHHPTEIRATLQGVREKYPSHAIVCVFQPHQMKRLEALFEEFQSAFEEADITMVLPIYKVPGRDETEHKTYNSKTLVEVMQKKYPNKPIFYLNDPNNLQSAMQMLLTSPIVCGPNATGRPMGRPVVIVMMGAGNIIDYTTSLFSN